MIPPIFFDASKSLVSLTYLK